MCLDLSCGDGPDIGTKEFNSEFQEFEKQWMDAPNQAPDQVVDLQAAAGANNLAARNTKAASGGHVLITRQAGQS